VSEAATFRGALSAVLAAAALAAVGACRGGAPGPLEIRFGHVGAPGSLFALSAEEFARVANARLGTRARVVVFGSSQLGGDDALLQKLKLGTVELALPSSILSSQVDAFGLFDMPYLIRDRDQMRKVEDQIVWPTLVPLAEEKGYHVLAVWENGFRHITNNVRPIVVPGDLAGIKLRTPRGRWRVNMFQAYGANPTPMALSETFVALQTGVMDGQENPLAQIYSSRLHEVQAYLSLTGHVYTPAYVTAGAGRWSRLPPDVREVLERTARETQAFVYATAARLDEEILAKLETTGIRINRADRDRFRDASRAIYREFGEAVPGGAALIERTQALGGP
jgi:TRAP-type transport system periplasmic protein